jgi:capsular polysaccharide transport system ATP-binding protein
MLELRHVTKIYKTSSGPNVVLRDLSLTLPARESIGVLGKNGAGKSTLLRIVANAEAPTAGEVIHHGHVVASDSRAFHGSLTGEENCRFAARIYGQNVDEVVEETREFADIGRYFYVPVRTYSTGMRARLAFGLSMSIDFDIYLVDEVTAVGDKAFRRKCRRLRRRRERAGLLMVSQKSRHGGCKRCIVLAASRRPDSIDEATAATNDGLRERPARRGGYRWPPHPPAPAPAPEPEKKSEPKVPKSAIELRAARRRILIRRFGLWVGLPTLIAIVYYMVIATPQYDAWFLVAVESSEGRVTDASGKAPNAGNMRDARLLRGTLGGAPGLAALDQNGAFRAHYRSNGDWLTRLDNDSGNDATLEYFRDKVTATHEAGTNISTVRVRAFSGDAAHDFATKLVTLAHAWVAQQNETSSAARK